VGSRASEGILTLCSALVRPPQESCIQLWSPQHRRHGAVGAGPEEATKMIRGMEHLCCEERLSWGCSAWRTQGSRETLEQPSST